VSLQAALTADGLRRLAGFAFARGDAYWRQGRVVEMKVDDDTLDGVVEGSERYHVRMAAGPRGGITASCTCPVGAPMCKHAVALGLAFLAGSPQPAAPAPSKDVFATRAELDAFVEAHDVHHAARLCAILLDVPDRGMRYMLGRASLRDLGSIAEARRLVGAAAPGLSAAVKRILEAEAASVRAGVAEEAQRPDEIADRVLAPLWAKLCELRAVLREFAPPISREARRAGDWRYDAGKHLITWTEPRRILRGHDGYPVDVATRLDVADREEPVTCSCGSEGCAHAVALIDATLDRLEDPRTVERMREIARELMKPSWARALDDLARLEAVPAEKVQPAIELWWELSESYDGYSLSPKVKKVLRRGGVSAGTEMAWDKLLAEYGDVLSERERQIAELYLAHQRGAGQGIYAWRAYAALVGHPRVLLDDRPIKVERMSLEFAAQSSGDRIVVEPTVGGARMNPKLLAALLEEQYPAPLLWIDPDLPRCVLVDVNDAAYGLWTVLQRHGDVFPKESHTQLLERLARLEGRVSIAVPHELKGRELNAHLEAVLRLRMLPDLALELEAFVRPAPDAPLFSPGAGPKDVLVVRKGERGYIRRDIGSEHAFVRDALAKLPPLIDAEEGPPLCFRIGDTDAALSLVALAQDGIPGLAFEWVQPPPHVSSAVTVDALRVKIERKRDWFGVDGELKIESGRLELAVLLDAARRQQRFVRVDTDRWVELSDALRERARSLAEHTFATRDRLELSPGAVPAIQALVAAGAELEAAPAWELLAERVEAARQLRPKPPAALRATLRDYQREGHAWLARLSAWGAGGCLADDMGLGKTVQAIALLLDRAKLGPALVLAPTSVALNWVRELERFAPSLRPIVYGEASDRTACLAKLGKKDVLIASYGLLVRDAEALAGVKLATLVIDEAQALKNPSTHRARAARRLDADVRFALSGTPFENHLGELWSVFSIVFPGLLGSWDQFRDRYAVPIERHHDVAARDELSRVLRPFLLRRTKQEVARELPAREEIEVPIALSDEEAALYEDARLAAVAALSNKKLMREQQQRFRVLAAITRLRLLASHPKLYDPRSKLASSKLTRLLELLDELRSEGHRVLVFSQFTSHLALVREELDRLGYRSLYLDGATPQRRRAELVDEFQAGEADVFLISLKAGGTGINLTAADYVIHLDPWWNPAVEDQATDRAHRIGQTRPVTVYRLVAKGTIEEQILSLHRDKRALVAGILDGADIAGKLGIDELMALLVPQ
jgi:superfamily II DNA or RNA helicase